MKYFCRFDFFPYIKPYEIFFAVLNETAFYAKLLGRFSGSKIKVTRPIALKFITNMQINNLKLLSTFHVARPNRSRVISKSLKSHTHYSLKMAE